MGIDDNDAFSGVSRKRMKKEKTWQKNTYLDTKIAAVPARQIGEPCSCQCFSKIAQDYVQQIFNAFWVITTYKIRTFINFESIFFLSPAESRPFRESIGILFVLSSPFLSSQNAQRMIPSRLETALRGRMRKANSTPRSSMDDTFLYLVCLRRLARALFSLRYRDLTV
ncbi:hypothetical protein AVEN_225923-1 [Araneus ventricosus]|uniref:Uncharacterized protein n=1 Tax=Araneus ventricosus TaxID=182803 RepID=A0A4Y2BE65_ARAVE|nr:hypothetical protein AVEN_225923-1 [Araneus ventricosus]